MSAAKWAGVGFVAGALVPFGVAAFAHQVMKGFRFK